MGASVLSDRLPVPQPPVPRATATSPLARLFCSNVALTSGSPWNARTFKTVLKYARAGPFMEEQQAPTGEAMNSAWKGKVLWVVIGVASVVVIELLAVVVRGLVGAAVDCGLLVVAVH